MKERTSKAGDFCEVYRNLHTGTLSVRTGGLVVDHPMHVMLWHPHFVVQPAGRARVLRERRKNVHAWVKGIRVMPAGYVADTRTWREAYYNPYTCETWIDRATKRPVLRAKHCELRAPGLVRYLPYGPGEGPGTPLESRYM